MKEIRQLIREMLLEESMSQVAKANSQGLAVWASGTAFSRVIIYDPEVIKRLYKEYKGAYGFKRGQYNFIHNSEDEVSIVKAGVTTASSVKGCNRASEVLKAASEAGSGLGPAAYEIAMYYSKNGLTSDRIAVSDSASSVWEKYKNRSDVESLKFDDIDDPRTVPTDDDCRLHKDRAQLNRSYTLKNKPDGLDEMESRHEEMLSFYDEFIGEKGKLENELTIMNNRLFSQRYDEEND